MQDHRDAAARVCARAPWETLFFFRFRCCDHINVKELRALVRLVLRLGSARVRGALSVKVPIAFSLGRRKCIGSTNCDRR